MTLEATIQSLVASGLRRPNPSAEYERTVLATGSTGSSSIVVSLEDVASVWLEQLGMLKDVDLRVPAPEYRPGKSRLKMAFPDMNLFIDAIDLDHDGSDPNEMDGGRPGVRKSEDDEDNDEEEEDGFHRPRVTLKLIQQLPDAGICAQLLDHLDATMRMHPSFNFPNFRRRVEAMLDPTLYDTPCQRDEACTHPSALGRSTEPRGRQASSRGRPSLAFFSAAVGGLALGARTAMTLPSSSSHATSDVSPASSASAAAPAPSPPPIPPPPGLTTSSTTGTTPKTGLSATELERMADGLFTLSKQALAVTEFEQHYDLDFIAAVILNGLFLLHDGKPRVAHTIYPTMGKLINISRMMGLHIDPDEFPGKYSLFDAEARRRTWWDVYYYDL